ncbi:MAG: hypothetical protein P8X74_03835 [Reinekea sp.]
MIPIKCFLHVNGFFAPIKTATVLVKNGATDQEIMESAEEELYKDFRVEFEDIEEKCKSDIKFEQVSRQVLLVDRVKYRKADLLKLHGLTPNQYQYLRHQRKYSMREIYLRGKNLLSRSK